PESAGMAAETAVSVPLAGSGLDWAFALVTAPAAMVSMNVPAAVAVTVTLTVHAPLAGIDPPLKAIDPPPPVAVTTPPQVVEAFGVVALTTFAGKVSVKAMPVMTDAFGFVNVIVSTESCPMNTLPGENAFATTGPARALTVSVADPATVLLPALATVTPPTGMVSL